MKDNTSETVTLVDQVAVIAHEMVDRVHERATEMEDSLSKKSQDSGERIAVEIERGASSLENYIEANPVIATAAAFGLGIFATQLFKTVGVAPSGTDSAEATPSVETQEATVSKAA